MSTAKPPALLAEATRAKLLDSAGWVFAESGYQAATVREICARAGVNAALVNYHFGDKLELYAAVLRQSLGSSANGIIQEALQSKAPPEVALGELVHAILQRICRPDRPGWHYQLMVHELAQPTPAMKSVIDETMRPIFDRFRELVAVMRGLPADHDTTILCAHSVIAQVIHYKHSERVIAQLWPQLEMTPQRIAQIAAHIADFSLAYINQAPCGKVSPGEGNG